MPDDALVRSASKRFRDDPPRFIGVYQVRASSNELAGPDGIIRLRPRLMDVLLRLAASAGEVVERQRLLDDVWPRRLVADEVLSRTIGELRTVLGDDAREAVYIETIPKVGYRLIAPVDREPARPAVAEPAIAPSPVPPPRRLRLPHARWIGSALVLAAVCIALLLWARMPERRGDPAGRVRQQLETSEPFSSDLAMELGPRFAPDGNSIVFALGDGQRTELVIQDVRTRTRTTIGAPPGLNLNPVFFPDGQRIAYWRSECVIVERDLRSGVERELVPCARRPLPQFDLARDGQRLVYATVKDGAPGLRVLDLRSGAVRELTTPAPDVGDDRNPKFSPDGSSVAFLRGRVADRSVWLVSVAEPDKVRALGTRRGVSWGLAWLGNDGPLLVSADWFGFRALNVVDLASGMESLAGARGAQFPDASRNGDLVYETAAYQSNLWLLRDSAADQRTQLWPSTRYTNYPEFSPDGSRVLFNSNRDNVSSVFIGTLDGAYHRLPLHAGWLFGSAHWAADGRTLYAAHVEGDGEARTATAVRIDVETGAVRALETLGNMVAEIQDADRGRVLYYGEWDNGLLRLWRAPLDALDRRELLPLPRVEEFAVRGNRLAYRASRSSAIVTCTLPQLSCETVPLPSNLQPYSGWALSNDALWIGVAGEPGNVVRFDLVSQHVTRTLPFAPSAIGRNLAVSPDEHQVIVARQEPPAIDLMLARRSH
ncbi:MAG TPA: winged helix-turn-helix domain-containing protein [Casimicrobiaceae bacterium]|nr:winged helix-turn-helix domain-containing protein [Casimicrobiaceae bacterium]